MTPPAAGAEPGAFSDGVLAIVITLLVLDLRVAAEPGHLAGELARQSPT